MRINHNIAALNTYSRLSAANNMQAKSLEKLSSGMRINRAGDDAAGLAISEKMRAQIRGLEQATRNAQDGISLIQTAEGALNETQAILQRMRELAVQASNDTNVDVDRGAIQDEINQLIDEIDRIANTTEFNTRQLLTGEIGVKVSDGSKLGNVSMASVTKAGTVNIGGADATALASAAEIDLGQSGVGQIGQDETAANAAGKLIINGVEVTFSAGESYESIAAKITSSVSGVEAEFIDNGTGTDNEFYIRTTEVGADVSLTIGEGVANQLGSASNMTTGNEETATGSNADLTGVTFTGSDGVAATYTLDKNTVTLTSGDQEGLTFTITDLAINGESLTVGGSLQFQIGANESQSMSININAMDANSLGVSDIDLSTAEGASEAITTINDAITSVSSERAKLGAYQNRLEHTINNLGTAAENLTASESRIRDVDMAKEMMEFTKNNILNQAATAMLAQAQQQPSGVLQLLR